MKKIGLRIYIYSLLFMAFIVTLSSGKEFLLKGDFYALLGCSFGGTMVVLIGFEIYKEIYKKENE